MSRKVLARTLNRTIVVLLVGFVAACQTRLLPEGPDPSKALADLQRADSMIQAAIAARDAERTASFYAENAVLMPVAEPAVEGRVAILEEWRHVFGIPGFANRATLVAAEPSVAGDLGYTRGTYESPMSGPDGQPLLERGKWVSVWKRQDDGQWRIIVDIFNTDSPPPVHASSTAAPSRQKP
jgi:ketosteroid isomerase-like protein